MTGGITPGRAAGELGLALRPPVSWDAVLDAAVDRYWRRRREQREEIPAEHASRVQ